MSIGTLRAWLDQGVVRRVFRGVYVPSDLTDSLKVRAACAALILPAHCVVVERSAAWLHGIDLHDPDERFTVPDLEVVSLREHTSTRRHGVYSGVRDLKARDITQLDGVQLTTPLRTALDLGCLKGELPALAALDAFERRFEITRLDLEGELPRFRRRRGVVQLRRLIPLATPLAESPGESWLRGILIRNGFAAPQPQIELWESGVLRARIDLGYRHLRIAIEYFGEEFHGPEQEPHDRARIEWLEAHGWYVIVFRKQDLSGPALQAKLVELSQVVAERSQPRGRRCYPRGEQFFQ